MRTNVSDRENGHGHKSIDLEPRTRRALTESMSVLPETDPVSESTPVASADGIVLVCSESGSEYVVDVREGRCTCPDARERDLDNGCKHQRRARFATGIDPIPVAVFDALGVDPLLGEHTDSLLQFLAADGGTVVAADDEDDGDGDGDGGNDEPCLCELTNDGELGCFEHYRVDGGDADE